jgi:uncharacterized protein involved in exopolysaccharide biosynthesis
MNTESTPVILNQRPAPRREESATTDLQHVIGRVSSVMIRRKWSFIIPLLTGMIISLGGSFFLPREYTVNAIFERRDDDVISKLRSSRTPYSFKTFRQSLNVDMRGYHAMSRALAQIGATSDLPRNEDGELTQEGRHREQALIGSLNKRLSVGLMEKSEYLDMVKVRYTGPDADFGVKLVRQLKNNYVEKTRKRMKDMLVKSYSYFQKEAEKARRKVTRLEMEISRMTREHPGISPADSGILDKQLLEQDLELKKLERQQKEAQHNLELRQKALERVEKQISGETVSASTQPARELMVLKPNPRLQEIDQDIDEVTEQIKQERDLGKTNRHPDVVRLYTKLKRLKNEKAGLPTRIEMPSEPSITDNTDHTTLKVQKSNLQIKIKELQARLAEINEEIAAARDRLDYLQKEKEMLSDRQQEFLFKRQELDTAKSDFKAYKNRVEDMSRVLQADSEDRGIHFSTVVEAREPSRPSSPALKSIYFLTVCIGLALAVGTTFLREVLDRSYRDPARVRESVGLPILESIGEIQANPRGMIRWRGRMLGLLSVLQLFAVIAVAGLVYISLRQPILFDSLMNRLAVFWPL